MSHEALGGSALSRNASTCVVSFPRPANVHTPSQETLHACLEPLYSSCRGSTQWQTQCRRAPAAATAPAPAAAGGACGATAGAAELPRRMERLRAQVSPGSRFRDPTRVCSPGSICVAAVTCTGPFVRQTYLRSSKSLQLAGGVPRRPAGPPPPRPMRRYARPATRQFPRLPPPALPALPRGGCSPPSFRFQVLRDGGQVQLPLLQRCVC